MNDISVRGSARVVSHYVIPIGAAMLARHLCYFILGLSRSGSAITALMLGVLLYYSGKHTYCAFFFREEEQDRPIQPAAAWKFLRNLLYIQLGTGALTLLAWWFSRRTLVVYLGCGTLSYLLLHRCLTPFDLFHRGRRFLTFSEAKKKAELLRREYVDLGRLFFGGLYLSWSQSLATTGFLIIGAIGTGKTLLIRALQNTVLPLIGKLDAAGQTPDLRAIVYDRKGSEIHFLRKVSSCEIWNMNAFVRGGAVWDIALDITEPVHCEAFAEICIPIDPNEKQKYFDEAARSLWAGVLEVFLKRKVRNWSFFDLIHALRNEARLRAVLVETEEGRDLIRLYLSNRETALDVMSTIGNKTKNFRFIAYMWDHAVRDEGEKLKMSLTEFVHGDPGILLLVHSHRAAPAVRAMNNAMLFRLTQLLLDLPDSRTRQLWCFADEARSLGSLEGNNLSSFIVEGRSKGGCFVGGTQDLDGWLDANTEKRGRELIGQLANRAVLGLRSETTAEWAAKMFGEYEAFEYDESSTKNDGGGSSTVRQQLVKRQAVLPSEFDLPETGPENGLTGFFAVPCIDAAYRANIPWQVIEEEGFMGAGGEAEELEKRPVDYQYARAWGPEDLLRLGIRLDSQTEKEADEELARHDEKKRNEGQGREEDEPEEETESKKGKLPPLNNPNRGRKAARH